MVWESLEGLSWTLLTLLGSGLFGIVVAVGACCGRGSGPSDGRFLDWIARVAKVGVPAILICLYLETSELIPPVEELWATMVDEVENLACQ